MIEILGSLSITAVGFYIIWHLIQYQQENHNQIHSDFLYYQKNSITFYNRSHNLKFENNASEIKRLLNELRNDKVVKAEILESEKKEQKRRRK